MQIFSSSECRNLATRAKTAVASLNTSRGTILPPLTSFEEFPRELLTEELRTQFAESTDNRKLPSEANGSPSTIEVTQDFFMGDREITVGQFQQFIDDPDYPATEKVQNWRGVDTSASPTADHPAQQVSWFDAVRFCNWLSHRERLSPSYVRTGEKHKDSAGKETEDDAWRLDVNVGGYRLPTSAEWEYACRAGTTTKFSSGDDATLLAGYCQMASSLSAKCGSKLPNGWGMFDVHGNVWEWCEDSKGSDRVVRGGSWSHVAANCRTAIRLANDPANRCTYFGFRLALSPSIQSPEVKQGE